MIDKERILALTDGGLRIFCHYLGFEVNLHRNFRSPFYDDKRASCHIYYDKRSSTYKYYDHGNPSYAGDCFWFVSELRGIDLKTSFPELLQTIAKDLDLCILDDVKQLHKFVSTKMKPTAPISPQCQTKHAEKADELPYSFEIQPFDAALLAYWAHYGIYEETLRRFRVRALKSWLKGQIYS